MPFPAYTQLPRPDRTGLPLAWQVWGADDRLGTLNHISAGASVEAARLVGTGHRINLDLPLDLPLTAVTLGEGPFRAPPHHHISTSELAGLILRDDKLDDFYLQGASQWDGLGHIADPDWGAYNSGLVADGASPHGSVPGIDRVAKFGIFARGVLVDLVTYFQAIGRNWWVIGSQIASVADVTGCLAAQRTEIRPGDVLILRMGWVEQFKRASPDERNRLFHGGDFSGVIGDESMWAFLWDRRIAALAADTISVETFPLVAGRPSLHWAIARLGLTLGELFDVEALASYCRALGRYEFLLVAKPLYLAGGIGSPANAMAVF